MYDILDEKALFSSLQSELNSRVISRSSVNNQHILIIVTVFFGIFAAKYYSHNFIDRSVVYLLSFILPVISYYFVSLYIHNDLQIGLLNRTLRRIEITSNIPQELRFYDTNAINFSESEKARRETQIALMGICIASPAFSIIDILISCSTQCQCSVYMSYIDCFFFVMSICISGINFFRVYNLDLVRTRIRNDEYFDASSVMAKRNNPSTVADDPKTEAAP